MLELYFTTTCPYCIKVLTFFEQHSVKFVPKEISLWKPSPLRDELVRLGGKSQVPFLVDPERKIKMYESDDIIAYAKEHYVPEFR